MRTWPSLTECDVEPSHRRERRRTRAARGGRAASSGASRSWDLDLADGCRCRALGHVGRQQPQSVFFALGLDGPPDRVAAGAARGERFLVAKWTLVALERGEHDAALARLVAVLEQVTRHGSSLPPSGRADIGATP